VPRKKVLFKNLVYYIGGTNDTGFQLYSTDGTAGGTNEISQLDDWVNGQIYFQSDLIATDDFIFFVGGRAFNRQLWFSDGTTAGTNEIVVNPNGESTPERLILYDNKLIFFANGDGVGYEPHYVDVNTLSSSKEEEIASAVDIYPNPSQSFINIKTNFVISRYTLYDILGNAIVGNRFSDKINIDFLKNGIYMIELEEEQTGKKVTKKFMVKK